MTEAAVQENIAQPAYILDVGRHVQSEHTLERLTVPLGPEVLRAQHCVYGIAGDEADRKKDDEAQYEQRGDDQQQPPDDIGPHVTGVLSLFDEGSAGKLEPPSSP